jgi:hypothetical protein
MGAGPGTRDIGVMPTRASIPVSIDVDLRGPDCVVATGIPRAGGTALSPGAGAALSERTHPCDLVRAAMPTAHRRPLRSRLSGRVQHTMEERC